MNRFFGALGSIVLLIGIQAGAQSSRASLQGVWQAVEVQTTGQAARTITIPEPRPNLIILAARHYSRVAVESEGPRPVLANAMQASADELRATWMPFAGEAGTYEVSGPNEITMRPTAAKNPAAMAPGAFTTYGFKLDGGTLWVTQRRSEKGPFANPTTIKLVRVE